MNVHIRVIEDVLAGIALAKRGLDRKTHFRSDVDGFEMFHLDVCSKCGKEMVGGNPVRLWKVPMNLMDAAEAVLLAQGLQRSEVWVEGGCNDDGEIVCPDCHED
jgi:hypothetical protein